MCPAATTRRSFLPAVIVALIVVTAETPRGAEPAGPTRHALLIGCTKYPSLTLAQQLEGPANDVALMNVLVIEQYGLVPEQVRMLVEDAGEERRPTRAHIEREFQSLAERTRRGDEVLILMCGHGSRQPDQETPDPLDPEPDGLDEVFLPADIGRWTSRTRTIENAITDDELGTWLASIRHTGAHVWIIMDACHSGTMIRGDSAERARQVPEEMLVPRDVLAAARGRAAALDRPTRGIDPADEALDLTGAGGGIVALYAAQSTELTVELPLPPDGEPRRPYYGLLTYAVNQVLRRATDGISYRELAHQVYRQYRAWDRRSPTPFFEGTDLEREVFGGGRRPREPLVLRRGVDERVSVSAGTLYGLTAGSILSVHSGESEVSAGDPLGFVVILRADALSSRVGPVAWGGLPASESLPDGGVCRLVFRDYGDSRLRVAADPLDVAGQPATTEASERMAAILARVESADGSLVRIVPSVDEAVWLVSADADSRLYLTPTSGWTGRGDGTAPPTPQSAPPRFGPSPSDQPLEDWLRQRFARIARAQTLLSLAAEDPRDSGARPRIDVEIVRMPDHEVIAADERSSELRLPVGGEIAFRIVNRGTKTVDVTLLYVDDGYGITALIPRPGWYGDARLQPGQAVLSTTARIPDSAGEQEHVVALAVPAQAQAPPAEFDWLAQPSLEAARGVRAADRGTESPLVPLLESAFFGAGTTRGLETTSAHAEFSCRVVTWRVVPASESE